MSPIGSFEPRVPFELQTSPPSTENYQRKRRRSLSSSSSCTVGHNEELEVVELFEEEIIDLTYYDQDQLHGRLLHIAELPMEGVHSAGGYIQVGDFIEVGDTHMGRYAIDFLEVKAVVRRETGQVHIRGIPFTRTRNLMAKLPKKANEVCKILHIERSSEPSSDFPVTVDVKASYVVRKRRMIYSNSLWPENSFVKKEMSRALNKEQRLRELEDNGTLVCRWKFTVFFKIFGRVSKPDEEVLERVQSSELPDPRYGVSDEVLCNRWRGGRVKGGSWCPYHIRHLGGIDLERSNADACLDLNKMRQKYTLFDSFSGAGGVSRGAQAAGLRVEYAVDHEPNVWQTYEENFPNAKLYKTSIDGFIQESRLTPIRVDFLHLSPPCQFFSPAHTRESANDDANVFALFGCNELINKLRPRIITLEQTYGITHDRHLQYLRPLIGDLTQFGYSVRWKVVKLATWGSAQDRKRLILLAAGPGERLPPFPPPTHSGKPEHGLKPLHTIRRAVSGVRLGDSLHDLQSVKYHRPPRPPYDADQLGMTITTGCGQMYYFDGTRDFTLREYASLQGFPRHHQFMGTKTAIKKQIGNAFPPNTVRVLYKFLRQWLEKEDGIEPSTPSSSDIIMLDDEPNDAPVRDVDETRNSVRSEVAQVIDLT